MASDLWFPLRPLVSPLVSLFGVYGQFQNWPSNVQLPLVSVLAFKRPVTFGF